MSKTGTVTQLLQARLENAIRRRRENPSRSDLLMIPVLALALDACGGGGSQRPTPPPPPPPPPPAATITADATATVAENAAGATIAAVTTANATSTSVDNDDFEVVGGNLKLKDGISLDFEAADEVVVEITASGAGASATHAVTITVTDVNEAPTIEVAGGGDADSTAGGITASFTVAENSGDAVSGAAGAVLGLITLSDPDAGQTHTVTVDDDRFQVIDHAGAKWLTLKAGTSLDFEEAATVDLTLTVTDSGDPAESATADVTITVTDVNEAPTIEVAGGGDADSTAGGITANFTVAENSPDAVSGAAGAVLGLITLSDPDAGQTHTVTVDDDRFQVIDHAGAKWLTLKAGTSLDFEAENADGDATIDLTLTVTDDGDPAEFATADVTITVTDVNEAPTIEVAGGGDADSTAGGITASFTVAENSGDAVDGPAGAVLGLITLSDPDAGQTHTVEVDDDRFQVIDHAGAKWLTLKAGTSLDFEEAATVDLTLTVTDSGDPAESATADVTITVTDVNEKPMVVQGKEPQDRFEQAGDKIDWDIDLTGVFGDLDADDGILKYSVRSDSGLLEASGKPLELEISIVRGEDGKVMGVISSDKTIWSSHRQGSFDITVVATDDDDNDPQSGEVTFKVHVDDGDDAITAIELYERNADGTDGAKNVLYAVDVDENHGQEVVFGRVKVIDQDDPAHPHGMHEVTVDDPRFDIKKDDEGGLWLVLKAGNPLNYEEELLIQLVITAKPMMQNAKGEIVVNPDAATHFMQPVDVDVNDVNDAPEAIENPGNWWVTVDESLDAEDVAAGEWLTFRLEKEDDNPNTMDYPAFTDEDSGKNGELKYELVNPPAWLEITAGGEIRNKKGMLPPEANRAYDVAVKATDGGGLSDMFSFKLTVAFSGAGNQDNDGPDLSRGTSRDVNENPGADVVVATFTVSDDDSGLTGHPFAPLAPRITKVVNADDNNDSNNSDINGMTGYGTAFKIEPVGSTGTYRIVTTDKAKNLLDHEKVDDLTITVSVEDGAGASDTLDISVDIRDVNEAPDKQAGGNVPAGGTAYAGPGNADISVEQEEGAKEYLWIKLFDFWNDPDADDDDNDLTSFTASSDVPWIKVIHQPQPWEDIRDGTPAVAWGMIGGVAADDAGNAPTDDEDYVVVIEIDRTMANNKQADVAAGGTITLTARDKGGMTGMETIKVNITDENLPIGANAVTLTGSVREGGTLRAVFDEAKDPDLAGDPEAYQVVYAWYASPNADGSGGDVRQKGLSDRYTMTQEDVGKYIRVDVTYRELEPDSSGTMDFTDDPPQPAGSAVASGGKVRNTPDRGVVHFNIQANANDDGLTAQVRIVDEDGVPAAGMDGAPEYIWQSSPNGISGWADVADDADRTDQALSLADGDGDGDHYRLKVMYTDEGGVRELHFSEPVRVGDLRAPSPPPTLSGAGAVGGTLRVDNAGGAGVQWQKQMGTDVGGNPFWVDIAGATGATLGITKEYAGATVRAVVTYSGAEGITATRIVASGQPISPIANTDPTAVDHAPKAAQHYVVEANVSDAKGVVVTTVEATVPVAKLFEDLDGDKLSYTVTGGPGTDEAAQGAMHEAIWIGGNDQGLLSFDANTGKLIYHTDEKGGHDGNSADGQGNIVTFAISAADGGNGRPAMAEVGIRLNVKPTDIMVTPSPSVMVTEGKMVMGDSDMTVATLDVQDENLPTHKYGTHTVTVDDDRFKVVKDTDDDGSTWILQVKKGSVFDFKEGGSSSQNVMVTLTATDGGGLSFKKMNIALTALDIQNDPADDPAPSVPSGEVPGLEDNEASDNDDKTDGTDSGNDDNDGGWTPPPPGMSVANPLDDGILVAEGDLLEDFTLMIDDLIDAA